MKLFIDQWNNKFYAKNVTQLKKNEGISGRISKMYVDDKEGKAWHVGWCIGKHWFNVYTSMREAA